MKGQHQRQVYIIGPTKISEKKSRVMTILSYIETCNRMAVCVSPSNIEEFESEPRMAMIFIIMETPDLLVEI